MKIFNFWKKKPVQEEPSVLKYEVSYLTSEGEIRGSLNLLPSLLFFEPLNLREGRQNNQVSIDTIDICRAKPLEIPKYKNMGLVVFLSIHVSSTNGQMRPVSLFPRARVLFRLTSLPFGKAKELSELISDSINKQLSSATDAAASLTYIPHYELTEIYDEYLQEEQSFIDDKSKDIIQNASHFDDLFVDEGKFEQENSISSSILTQTMVNALKRYLPTYLQLKSWKLTYSTLNHGSSYQVFINKCQKIGANLLVIKDKGKFVFGGFANTGWKFSRAFYGSGDCFVFTFGDGDTLEVFESGLSNDFFMITDQDHIAMGAGGMSAVYVNRDLVLGYSGNSDTFNNPCLSHTQNFMILHLEVWELIN